MPEDGAAPAGSAAAASPAVSVVIPTRNRADLLRQAVDSVFAQTVTDWELVIVDDASEDATPEVLARLTDPRVRVIRLERHSEQSTTRNTGARAARAPLTLSLDDDDLLPSGALEEHLDAHRRYPDVIASIGGFVAFDQRGSRRVHRPIRRACRRNIWRDVLFGWQAVAGQCAFRTEALARIGWWDPSFVRATDQELWARLSRHGTVALTPAIVLRYRVHAGQWRPAGPVLDRLMTEARTRAVDRLSGTERDAAEQILRARRLALEAFSHFLDARAGAALWRYVKLCVRMPVLLGSPLTRPMIFEPMSRCLVGSHGIRLGRRILDWVDRARGRQLDFSVRQTVEAESFREGRTGRETSARELGR